MKHILIDGLGHRVDPVASEIKRALLGDTNYVGTIDDFTACITASEESDDISISKNDDHFISFPLDEIDEAIRLFVDCVDA